MSWLLGLGAALVVGIVVGSANVVGPGACGPGTDQAISKVSGSPPASRGAAAGSPDDALRRGSP